MTNDASREDRAIGSPARPATTVNGAQPAGGPRSATAPHRRALRPALGMLAWVALGVLVGIVAADPGGHDELTASLPVNATGVAVIAYLTAAVFDRRWVGWIAALVLAGLVVLADQLHVHELVVFLVVGVGVGLVGMVVRPRTTTPQALAAIGYLGVAVLGLLLMPPVGLFVAGLAFATHAVWDVIHLVRDSVVSRSLALWCIGLDLTIGAACVVAAIA